MKQVALLVAFVAGIPIFGLAVGSYIRSDYQSGWLTVVTKQFGDKGVEAVREGRISFDNVCKKPPSEIISACDTFNHVSLLVAASSWALIIGLSLLAGIYLAAKLAGSNRARFEYQPA